MPMGWMPALQALMVATMKTTKRCAVYLRVSTDRQQVQNQLAEVQQLVGV